MLTTALARIPVGVVVERRPARSLWLDALWRPIAVLPGVPTLTPWTPIAEAGGVTHFYAGDATIELHRQETQHYRDNLSCRAPLLWVVLRPTGAEPAPRLLSITGDPATGEALTGAGTDLVETVPMPVWVAERFAAFISNTTWTGRPIGVSVIEPLHLGILDERAFPGALVAVEEADSGSTAKAPLRPDEPAVDRDDP